MPADLRRFALKTVIKTLEMTDNRENTMQILAMLPLNCTVETAFSGQRVL